MFMRRYNRRLNSNRNSVDDILDFKADTFWMLEDNIPAQLLSLNNCVDRAMWTAEFLYRAGYNDEPAYDAYAEEFKTAVATLNAAVEAAKKASEEVVKLSYDLRREYGY